MEALEDRALLSATSANPLAIVSVASPPPVPSVAAITSYVESTMDQWMQLLATVQQDISNAFNALGQEIAQEVSAVQQQWDHLLGINPHTSIPSLNTVPHSSSDSGTGRGNGSGSGSGGGAPATTHSAPNQVANSTQQSGYGSGSGSNTTTTHVNAAKNGLGIAQPLDSGSGPATVYGNVWLDSDYDGSPDNGELGYYGATVNLLVENPDGTFTGGDSTTTDSSGDYQFTIEEDPIGHTYEVQVVFPWSFFATQPGYSQINAQGYTDPFLLAAGAVVQKNAGISSMNVSVTQDDAFNQKIQNKVTLRDAIQTGNNGPPQPAVTFYSAPNTPLNGTITLQAALDPIKTSYNIDGPGASTLTVSGNNQYQVFTVNAGVTSEIDYLTIQNGYVKNGNGGGILNSGNLTLLADTITGNQVSGIAGGGGGGIYNSAGALLKLYGVTLSNNTATVGGGLDNAGTVIINFNSVIQSNTASFGGGGIFNEGGRISCLDGTKIQFNKDVGSAIGIGNGAGVDNQTGSFWMDSGVILYNQELKGGGGGGVEFRNDDPFECLGPT